MWMIEGKQKAPEAGPHQGQPQSRPTADEPAELGKEEERSLRPKGRRLRRPECRRGTSRHGEAKAMVDRRKSGTTKVEHVKAERA